MPRAGQARELVDQGFTALKMVTERKPWRFLEPPAGMEPTVRAVAAVREEVGDGVDIAIDLHRRLSPAMSRVLLRELEPYRLLFAEEPCHWENVEALVGVARATPVPIAVGERQITRWGFREVVEREAAAVLQPDIRACGGILEMRKIAALAESHYLRWPRTRAPTAARSGSPRRCTCAPRSRTSWSWRAGFSAAEGLFCEPLRLVDGFLELPTGPGLGFEIDPDAVAARTVDPEPWTGPCTAWPRTTRTRTSKSRSGRPSRPRLRGSGGDDYHRFWGHAARIRDQPAVSALTDARRGSGGAVGGDGPHRGA